MQSVNRTLYNAVSQIISEAKATVYRCTSTNLLKMYWQIGKLIIEDEQQ
ncbi:MAG: hypothetical protein H6607_09320 [Flavobacteriales bacterium]|nr:hypothetical protein [Flavobacteriales bacterium]